MTRFVEFTAMLDQTANTENILCRYTLPKVIISDNGTNFTSEIFKQTCKLLGITKMQTTPNAPIGNLVERQHSWLANYLRCFLSKKQSEWDNYIRPAAHAYNNTPQTSTKLTPMETLFGFTSELPSNLKRKPQPIYKAELYHRELRHKLQKSFQIVKENLGKAKEVSRINYNKQTKEKIIKVGDKVYIRKTNRSSKLSSHWAGPFKVEKINNGVNISILYKGKLRRIHVNRTKIKN